MSELDRLIPLVLDRIERDEAKLLAWGVVDGGMSETRLLELAEEVIESEGTEYLEGGSESIVQELYSRRLVFDLPVDTSQRAYRSRSAEAVRLFFRLRQLFPDKDWRTAPRLVSDYRWLIRERRFPKRHIKKEDALTTIQAGLALSLRHRKALEGLLNNANDNELELADFQVRATRSMLADIAAGVTSGMIVCTGTGSGKTLAFYLPALAAVADMIGDEYWTKAIAIYPRNELLKDQLSEVLFRTRTIRQGLDRNRQRPIRIGAYFGPTPFSQSERDVGSKWLSVLDWYKSNGSPGGYKSGIDGHVCPYFRCPQCEGHLAWHRKDREINKHVLRCFRQECNAVVDETEVVLTRRAMQECPPDVLFTTTETLNRRMSDSWSSHVFGVNASRPPRLMLLDEVHTYSGTSGAQAALLLRRWRAAINGPVHFTGLSATLAGPREFFSQLASLSPSSVDVIEPQADELDSQGLEYMLALRGDPGSGASLLSTSIQTAMLTRRVLDGMDNARSGGLYGKKVFVFTDDLDVSNRFYHNLLDAEGLDYRRIKRRDSLAMLRRHGQTDDGARVLDGQTWSMPEQIGHSLQSLRIGRTTSQDVGVDSDAEVIVATASLEVGFDDNEVGAVIQHKAPIDAAQFLQRKGRGGRRREMRPWTIVVLSDYGRDRLAYQGYDLLFDPTLEARSLPVENRYVLRMQAVFAMMEWIAAELRRVGASNGEVWRDLTRPGVNRYDQERQATSAGLFQEVLDGGPALRRLENHLRRALRVSEGDLQALLWDPPRSLMLSVIPTALRRLESKWGRAFPEAGQAGGEGCGATPLPEFLPPNLFTDLNLPEVSIGIEEWPDDENPPTLPIVQALLTLAPGRVSRRFSPFRGDISHWKAPASLAADQERQVLQVESYCPEYEALGAVQFRHHGDTRTVICYRPWRIDAETLRETRGARSNVLPTSHARPAWYSQISTRSNGDQADLPSGSSWSKLVGDLRFFLHGRGHVCDVRRFCLGSTANIRFSDGREFNAKIAFKKDNENAAVGFFQEVDGIRFRVCLPDDLRLGPDDTNRDKVHAHRVAYFKHRVQRSMDIPERVNTFQREWLARLYLSTLVERALVDGCSLESAHEAISASGLASSIGGVLDVVVQSLDPNSEPDATDSLDEPDETTDTIKPPKVKRVLLALLEDPTVVSGLETAARCLWEEPDAEWHLWGRRRFLATLGNALLEACLRLSPVAGDRDLILDVESSPTPPGAVSVPEGIDEIWITETSVGGVGVVEDVYRRYASDPRRFFKLVESALAPADFEVIDIELKRILAALESDGSLRESFCEFRDATGTGVILDAVRAVQRRLGELGVVANHAVMTALNSRVLRPGSSEATDALLRDLVVLWCTEEERLGIEVDAAVFAYTVTKGARLASHFEAIGYGEADDPNWRFQVVYGLLWPRGSAVRASSLRSYNPFERDTPESDRHLVADVVLVGECTVGFGSEGWREELARVLADRGSGVLDVSGHDATVLAALKTALLELATEPVEFGFLHVYPKVEGIERGTTGIRVRLYTPEALQ